MRMGRAEKRYVDVVARWRADGYVEPLVVCWPDGRSFQVRRVVGRPQSSAFPGSPGRVLRYTVDVRGAEARLFLELGEGRESARWYVEQKPGVDPWRMPGGAGT